MIDEYIFTIAIEKTMALSFMTKVQIQCDSNHNSGKHEDQKKSLKQHFEIKQEKLLCSVLLNLSTVTSHG